MDIRLRFRDHELEPTNFEQVLSRIQIVTTALAEVEPSYQSLVRTRTEPGGSTAISGVRGRLTVHGHFGRTQTQVWRKSGNDICEPVGRQRGHQSRYDHFVPSERIWTPQYVRGISSRQDNSQRPRFRAENRSHCNCHFQARLRRGRAGSSSKISSPPSRICKHDAGAIIRAPASSVRTA